MKILTTVAGVEGLQIQDHPVAEPGPGEVRVRVRASALNPADQKVLGGDLAGHLLHRKSRPVVVGYDFAGTVEAVGVGADLAVGDEVFGFHDYSRATYCGAFAETTVVRASTVARRPAAVSPAVACAIGTAGATALQCLRDLGRLERGQKVLIIGASGGVGTLAVGVGAHLGAEVTALCGASAFDLVRSLGATHVLDRANEASLREGGLYHVIFDTASAYTWFSTRHLLAPGGAYIATLPGPGVFAAMPFAWLRGQRVRSVLVVPVRAELELLASWAADGSLKVPIDSTFPVRDARAGLERIARGGMKGRVVIEVEGGW
jgi:NADPH:quinone reductase